MRKFSVLLVKFLVISGIILGGLQTLGVAAQPELMTGSQSHPAAPNCALLDDPITQGLMSAGLEWKLLYQCGRLPEAQPSSPGSWAPQLAADVLVNDPLTDSGDSTTQSGTSVAVNPNTGTVCVAYNDSQHWAQGNIAFAGFSRSTDGGNSFEDMGPFPVGGGGNTFGDPSLVWRAADGYFYYAGLHSDGLGLWRSTDDCQSFSFLSMIHTGGGDDREMMTVDNHPASTYYGRLYVGWTDFTDGHIYVTRSDTTQTWSTPVDVSLQSDVQSAWPTVAPNGDVYVAWVHWDPYPNGPISVDMVRSTNGGMNFDPVASPLTNGTNPQDATASLNCGRPALNENIRHIPGPQIAVGPNGCLHAVYSYDPDGFDTGDVINVYYRRSCAQGDFWEAEVQLNDDGTTADQWFPTISVGQGNEVLATWYDRRLDEAANELFDTYQAVSYNGGSTWEPNERISDVSSFVPVLNPNFDPIVATCYHGDYNQQVQSNGVAYIPWSDERNQQNGHPDPDIWFDTQEIRVGLVYAPESFTIEVPMGGTRIFPLALGNFSSIEMEYEVREMGWFFSPALDRLYSIPPSQGDFPRGVLPTSAGPVPEEFRPISKNWQPVGPMALLPPNVVYSLENVNFYYSVFDLGVPEELPQRSTYNPGSFPGAGEYIDGRIYVVTSDSYMYWLDPATGAMLGGMPVNAPPGSATYTGMAVDPQTREVFLTSTDVANSYLHSLDLETGGVTLIGQITNSPGAISLAIDGNGDLYTHDIVDDTLIQIDRSTAVGTVIGSIGYDANFGQGMAWDPATDTLYLTAFNNGEFRAELRIADRSTGNTMLVGVLGETTPSGLTHLPFLGIPGYSNVPWLNVTPGSAVMPADSTSVIWVTLDAGVPEITGPGSYEAEILVPNSLWYGELRIPVTMVVLPDYKVQLPLISR